MEGSIEENKIYPVYHYKVRTGSKPYKKMYRIILNPFFCEYQNQNHKINTNFVRPGHRPLRAIKTAFNLIVFYFDIRGKLSINNYFPTHSK